LSKLADDLRWEMKSGPNDDLHLGLMMFAWAIAGCR
jgi:hypothetical protein